MALNLLREYALVSKIKIAQVFVLIDIAEGTGARTANSRDSFKIKADAGRLLGIVYQQYCDSIVSKIFEVKHLLAQVEVVQHLNFISTLRRPVLAKLDFCIGLEELLTGHVHVLLVDSNHLRVRYNWPNCVH